MNFNYDRSGLELKKYGELHGIVQTNRLRTSKKFGPVEKENTRGGRHQGWPSRTEIDVILGDRHLTASTRWRLGSGDGQQHGDRHCDTRENGRSR